MSVEKIGDNSLFGRKYKGQNSLFLAFLWVFMQWSHIILPKIYISVIFLFKKQVKPVKLPAAKFSQKIESFLCKVLKIFKNVKKCFLKKLKASKCQKYFKTGKKRGC